MRRVLLVFALGLAVFAGAAPAADVPFAVIAAPGALHRRMTRETVALVFKRKQAYGEDGVHLQPVNLPPAHPLRRAFSHAILGVAPEALEDYWREMYFHGVLPPHVLTSEAAVVLFVTATPGAVGYASCIPAHGVDVVFTEGDVAACEP